MYRPLTPLQFNVSMMLSANEMVGVVWHGVF